MKKILIYNNIFKQNLACSDEKQASKITIFAILYKVSYIVFVWVNLSGTMHGIINESYKHDQDHSSDSPMKQRTT
jgi:hypothetical protein